MKEYEIFKINDRSLIKELINQDPYKLLDSDNYNELIVEVDNYEKKAFINTGELYVFINYDETVSLIKGLIF